MKLLIFDDYQLPVFACFLLFFAMLTYWLSLYLPKNNSIFLIARIFTFFSNILLSLTLLLRWINENYFPLSNLYESLIFLSWAISTIHLFIEYQTKSRLIGSISTPVLFLLSGFSTLTLPIDMQKALPLVPSLQSNWLMMHVSMMMVSYATLIIGSLFSILYLAFYYFSINKNNVFNTLDNKGNIIPPEYKKVYPNMGLTRGEHKGNMVIHFHVDFPESLTPEQIAKLSEIL